MDLLRLADRFSGVLSFADVRSKADDFIVDRLSYQFTTAVLCAFGVLCGVRSSYTVPIICWIPAQLRRYERAITSYCYANNTYFVPEHMRVPSTAQERHESLILYYQWLPWIFGVQAALFYLPKIIWYFAVGSSGYHVQSLVETASKLYTVPDFDREKVPSKIRENQIVHINSQLFGRSGRDVILHGRSRENRFSSCYLLICYIAVKILYLMNCLLQIGLIHLVIGTRPFSFSRYNHIKLNTFKEHFIAQFVHKISSGVSELIDTSSFPKRTFCDFTFRELASNHAYTVECILPLNIIVEKMYVFLYIWFILLGLITFIDLLKWIVHLIHCLIAVDRTRDHYVRTHLIDQTRYSDEEIKTFARNQLTGNNYFIMKLLSKNISTFVVVDIIDYFFKAKMSNYPKKDN